jgi:hypothetical protein
MSADQLLEASEKGRDEESRDAPVKPIGNPAVVALGKLVAEIGVGDGITEPGEVVAVIAQNVAVVEPKAVQQPRPFPWSPTSMA